MKKIIKAILRLIRHHIKDYLRNKRICSEQMREEFYNMVNVPVSMQGELSLSENMMWKFYGVVLILDFHLQNMEYLRNFAALTIAI